MLCRDWTLVKQIGSETHATPLKCRCWSCELCAPDRKRQLRALAYAGRPTTFLTLTVNPAWFADRNVRARELVHAWQLLRKRILRRPGVERLPFLAVVEATKAGEPHLHVLMRAPFIPQAWLSKQMQELIGARIVDIRRVDSVGRAAAYISKYLGKAPTKWQGCKRYWRSQDWAPKDFMIGDDNNGASISYSIFPGPLRDLLGMLLVHMFTIDRREREWVVFRPARAPPCLAPS